MTQRTPEQTESVDLVSKVEQALSPAQKEFLQKKGITDVARRSISELKNSLGKEGADIVSLLEGILPAGSTPASGRTEDIKFTEHPLDYITTKTGDWLAETTVGKNYLERKALKAAQEARGESGLVQTTTMVLGTTAGKALENTVDTIETGKKAVDNWKRFAEHPWEFLKGLWNALWSGNLKAYLGFDIDLGDHVEKFAAYIKIPKSLMGKAKALFSSEDFGKVKFADAQKLYSEYQKSPETFNLAEKLGTSKYSTPELATILKGIFSGEKTGGFIEEAAKKFESGTKLAELSMSEVIAKMGA